MDQAKSKNSSLTNVIAYALIGCIAFVVMKFEFPIMPGVAFLKFDFSDVIITIGMFIFGIVPGVIIALIRMLLSLIFSGFCITKPCWKSSSILSFNVICSSILFIK